MSDFGKGRATPQAVATMLLIVAAVGGAIWQGRTLRSFRPAQPLRTLEQPFDEESVAARLWQDPIRAVADYRAAVLASADKAAAEKLERSFMGRLRWGVHRRAFEAQLGGAELPSRRPLIMPVLVPGDDYAESVETRLRTRFAVVSALAVEGLSPESREHLGYVLWSRPRAAESVPPAVPYEWFVPSSSAASTRPPAVLVLWVDETKLGDDPVADLGHLVTELVLPSEEPREQVSPPGDLIAWLYEHGALSLTTVADLVFPPPPAVDVTILGPGSSNTLARMLRTRGVPSNPGVFAEDRLRILNYRATAPERLLLQEDPERAPDMQSLFERVSGGGRVDIDYLRTVSPDDTLVAAIVHELSLRGVDLTGTQDAVALIKEVDTFYGRAFPQTFKDAIGEAGDGREFSILSPRAQGWLTDRGLATKTQHLAGETVLEYSYMRGLDGMAPAFPEAASDGSGGVSVSDGEQHQPVGPSQLDYIRRMASRIRRDDRWLQEHGGNPGEGRSHHGIRAIGVVGTDPYDKQLILQALSAELPGTIFFTTDLDTRQLHSSQYHWSRNLLFASGFGLELARPLQGDVVPFRDNYQTSAFLATRMAIDSARVAAILDPGLSQAASETPPAPGSGRVASALDAAAERAVTQVPRDAQPEDSPSEVATTSAEEQNRHLQQLLDTHLEPLVFEVARSGAYQLEPELCAPCKQARDAGSQPGRDHCAPSRLHPPAPAAGALLGGIFPGLMCAAALLLVLSQIVAAFMADYRQLAALEDSQPSRPGVRGQRWRALGGELYRRPGLRLSTPVLLSLVILGVVLWFFSGSHESSEPMQWAEGISVWPTQGVRLLAIVVAIWGVIYGGVRIRISDHQLQRDFGLQPPDPFAKDFGFWKGFTFNLLGDPLSGVRVDADAAWQRYRRNGRPGWTAGRVLLLFALYAGLAFSIITLSEDPFVPARGAFAQTADRLVLLASVAGLLVAVLFVVDVTRECECFIRSLSHRPTTWPAGPLKSALGDLPDEVAAERLDVSCVSHRTQTVGALIVTPFVILLLMILSRNQYFDAWDWPVGLVIILGLHAVLAIACAFRLRRSAEIMRAESLQRLDVLLTRYLGMGDAARTQVDQTRYVMDYVRDIRRGSFSSWARNPILHALMIPFGGVGALALIDVLVKSGV